MQHNSTAQRAASAQDKRSRAKEKERSTGKVTHLNPSVAILRRPLRVVIAHAADKDVLLVAREQRFRVLVGRTVIDHLHAWRAPEDLVDLIQRDLPLELSMDTTIRKT